MPSRLSKLSIDEIRERYARADAPVSPQTLNKLKRDPRHGVRVIYESLKKRYARDSAERTRLDAMLNFERVLWRAGVQHIAGVDEVGMGPLAGPVIAAAVVFPPHTELTGIDDSKRLDLEQRVDAERRIRAAASGIGVGRAEVAEIDAVNIYHAGLLAMRRAVEALPMRPQHVLVDARRIPGIAMPQTPIVGGDGRDASIAAASVIAKVHRDAIMRRLDADRASANAQPRSQRVHDAIGIGGSQRSGIEPAEVGRPAMIDDPREHDVPRDEALRPQLLGNRSDHDRDL